MKWTEIAAIWFIVAVIASPFIGSYLAKRRARMELMVLLTEDANARQDRLRASLFVADSQLERERLAREAVIAITENQWQQNARKAESLGFIDEIEPKRAS